MKNTLTTQLTPKNYSTWKPQVLKLFKANGFEGYLNDSTTKPPKFIIDDDSTTVSNRAYATWNLIDQNLAAALYAVILPSLSYILSLETCEEIWTTLNCRLQSTNKSWLTQLKNELHNVPTEDIILNTKTMPST